MVRRKQDKRNVVKKTKNKGNKGSLVGLLGIGLATAGVGVGITKAVKKANRKKKLSQEDLVRLETMLDSEFVLGGGLEPNNVVLFNGDDNSIIVTTELKKGLSDVKEATVLLDDLNDLILTEIAMIDIDENKKLEDNLTKIVYYLEGTDATYRGELDLSTLGDIKIEKVI